MPETPLQGEAEPASCTSPWSSVGIWRWQKKNQQKTIASQLSLDIKNPQRVVKSFAYKTRAATTNKPDFQEQVLPETRDQKTWGHRRPRLLLPTLWRSSFVLAEPAAGTTTSSFTGKTGSAPWMLLPKVLPAPSLLWQAVMTPSFPGFKNRCLLPISVTNAIPSKFKCCTQALVLLFFLVLGRFEFPAVQVSFQFSTHKRLASDARRTFAPKGASSSVGTRGHPADTWRIQTDILCSEW